MVAVSHSRIETFISCPYKYKLKYVDHLDILPKYDPQSPLTVGIFLHRAIEVGFEKAKKEYYASYPIISDLHIEEAYKIEFLYPKILAKINSFKGVKEHEVEISTNDFKGYLDLVIHNQDGTVDIMDFKYSNNIDNYMDSGQLHEYAYFYEQTHLKKVNKLWFLFVPKIKIRKKQNESIFQFRQRIIKNLSRMTIKTREVKYDPNKVITFLTNTKHCLEEKVFPKNKTRLCDWCDYQLLCEKNIDYNIVKKGEINMQLPSATRRVLKNEVKKRKLWIYGQATSGKTVFLDKAPNPLNLNTDGNIKEVTMQYVPLKDIVTVEGRITKRKLAWEVFKETITELEKKQNDFKTIIIDLVEDTREMCRVYEYNRLGIEHESDSSFGKCWDIIKTEYLSTIRRFFNLDYENLVIVSHEDTSKDITKKTGDKITKIAPNIKEDLANKLAGMVDIIGRVVIHEDGSRTLNFKQNEVVFGGSRLRGLTKTQIPLDWNEFIKIYDDRDVFDQEPVEEEPVKEEPVKEEPIKKEPIILTMPEETPTVKKEVEEVEEIKEVVVKPKRRVRKVRN